MKVAVFGARGMLGSDVMDACAQSGATAFGFDLPEVDIRNHDSVQAVLPDVDWAVNCAAYTRVDDAEKERDTAFEVNARGAGVIAQVCSRRGTRLLHISTDYVFDGAKGSPYVESDVPNPLGAYGASKLEGERLVREQAGRFLIVRTQSLFGLRGPNFVRTIAQRLLKSDEPLRVVSDQFSSPTYTRHLAAAILELMKLSKEGIVNVANSEECSWCDFARAIAAHVKPGAVVSPIPAREYARPAPRPAYSVLDTGLFRAWTGHAMPTWSQALKDYLVEEKMI